MCLLLFIFFITLYKEENVEVLLLLKVRLTSVGKLDYVAVSCEGRFTSSIKRFAFSVQFQEVPFNCICLQKIISFISQFRKSNKSAFYLHSRYASLQLWTLLTYKHFSLPSSVILTKCVSS
jgi:hypothetical protein